MLLEHLVCSKCGCKGVHACLGDTQNKPFEEQFDDALRELVNSEEDLQLTVYVRRTERKQ